MPQDNRNTWLIAGAVGFVVFLILMALLGFGFGSAFLTGLVVAVVMALYQLFGGGGRTDVAPMAQGVRGPAPVADLSAARQDTPVAPSPAADVLQDDAEPTPSPASPLPVASVTSEPRDSASPIPPEDESARAEPVDQGPANAPEHGVVAGARPAALEGPRDGKSDDLKRIKGIGPKLEQQCNTLGFYHFDQIAAWDSDEVAWVDANLEGFKGRVSRDTWVEQAQLLAEDGKTRT